MRHYILSAAVTLGCTVAAGAESVRERTSTEMKTGSEVLGIDPSLSQLYQPATGSGHSESMFQCLDENKTLIPFRAVNDDFCDCPDGSDEPGTSACSYIKGRKFWCKNEGHISAWIWSSRVGDGICDPECCDGSDENSSTSGIRCPNTCVETGGKYRETRDAENKIRKTGAKIRSTYISYAKNERVRLETRVAELSKQVEAKKDQVEGARVRLERLESSDRAEIERRQNSPLYLSFLEHRKALSSLRQQLGEVQQEREELKSMLQALYEGYNPNYQDMAVKAAVVGFTEKYVAQPAQNSDEQAPATESTKMEFDEEKLDELEGVDLVNLVMSGEPLGDSESEDEDSLLYRLDQYVPDSLYESYESVRDILIAYLVKFGLVGGNTASTSSGIEAAHTAAARTSFNELTSQMTNLERDLDGAKRSIEKLGVDFGPEGEWKKLENTCIEKEQGDYTYSLCFFGQASQKSNKDGAKHNLGTFADWNAGPTAPSGTEQYYSKQLYNKGLKCWNGPERSVKVDLSCGTSNELLHVSEPEKCEYYFKATSPALCWPISPEDAHGASKQASRHHAAHQDL